MWRFFLRLLCFAFVLNASLVGCGLWLGQVLPTRGVITFWERHNSTESNLPQLLDVDRNILVRLDPRALTSSYSPDGTLEARYVMGFSDSDMTIDVHILSVHSPLSTQPTFSYSVNSAITIPNWSHDNTRLAFSGRTASSDAEQLFIYDITSATTQQITHKGINLNPKWSNDNQRFLYQSWRNNQWDLALWELATGEITWLTDTEADESAADWSPNNQQVVYVSNASGQPDIYVLDVASGESHPIIYSTALESSPAWSRDGRTIAFVRFDNTSIPQILLYDVATQTSRRITRGLGALYPSWWR
jgi:Tol biopolymer transport system component